ncbi:Plasmodium exported protein, unknown function [Plasmodium sp.]|nr:Plasmodium exported protein, unknown function [Plasmodium sp.]SOV84208.1 Plasmodium exported protein, unknown function [Plasmodium sp.]
MNFFYINIFLLFVFLRHFISIYKESVKYTLTRNSLTKETRLNDKLPNKNDEIDETKNGHYVDDNLQDQTEENYEVNKKLNNELEKYKIKNNCSKSSYCIIRLKNWLYRKIFKESNFWAYVSTFTGVLGGAAAVSLFSTMCAISCTALLPAFAGLWGFFAIILILLIIGTWMLVTWLWPHKEVYNETCGK